MTQKTTNPGYEPLETLTVRKSLKTVKGKVLSTTSSYGGTLSYRENGFTAEFDGHILEAEETEEGEVYIERYEQELGNASEDSWDGLQEDLEKKEPTIASD